MADKLQGDVPLMQVLNYVKREPIGVVGHIVPEFPADVYKLEAGAVFSGRKHSRHEAVRAYAAFTLRVAELALEVGFPPVS